jgi:excisionase family DNA binding protein
MTIEPEFYSIKEAAVIFSVHENTIRKAIRMGFIVAIRIGNCKKSPYRISKKTIDKIHIAMIQELSKKASL